MHTHTIRQQFIQFFAQRGHTHLPPAPLLNQGDPTLLFVNAGMNPFKPLFFGQEPITHPRVTTLQPCLRVAGKHNDLETVGSDHYHHTLFEMAGNWSFGDYFKPEAIDIAWEFLTKTLMLPPERLYATTFAGDKQDQLPPDHQAQQLWRQYLRKDHILPFGKKDNFWEMGSQGPCGPCSEIHIDLRSKKEQAETPAQQLVNQDHPQLIELWNLVFIQYNRTAEGSLQPLSSHHIDTGMGVERLAMVLQGHTSTYATDLFAPLLRHIETLAQRPYQETTPAGMAMRVIADHLRAVAFAIASGALPQATGAGYVVRLLLRRALRYGYAHLGIDEPFIHQLVAPWVGEMAEAYPELQGAQEMITAAILQEEKTFLSCLGQGLSRFQDAIQGGHLSGEATFILYDRYGFPLDLTLQLAQEEGIKVDEEGFHRQMQQQKQRGQVASTSQLTDWEVVHHHPNPQFVGYDTKETDSQPLQWRKVTQGGTTHYQLVLDQTPFYPLGGGEVADRGWLITPTQKIPLLEVQKEHGLIIHTIDHLPIPLNQPLQAKVDLTYRHLKSANHTATHLLHYGLRKVLGPHVAQKGSLVTPQLLRFDFTHSAPLTPEQLQAIEEEVNEQIQANHPLHEQRNLILQEAENQGAIALFTEKYSQKVRLITFGPSIELCGGTHLQATGQLGLLKITHSTAVAAGIRRIEASTGQAAHRWLHKQQTTLAQLNQLLGNPSQPVERLQQLLAAHTQAKKEAEAYQIHLMAQKISQLQEKIQTLPQGRRQLVVEVEPQSPPSLKKMAGALKQPDLALVLATIYQGRVELVIALSPSWCSTHHAAQLMQSLAPYIEGKGGGSPHFAAMGGGNPDRLALALEEAKALLAP